MFIIKLPAVLTRIIHSLYYAPASRYINEAERIGDGKGLNYSSYCRSSFGPHTPEGDPCSEADTKTVRSLVYYYRYILILRAFLLQINQFRF